MGTQAAGERLKEARKRAGLNQAELDVDAKTVAKIENGEAVSPKSLKAIDTALARSLPDTEYRPGDIQKWLDEATTPSGAQQVSSEMDGSSRTRRYSARLVVAGLGCGLLGIAAGLTFSLRSDSTDRPSAKIRASLKLNPELNNARVVGPVDADKACADQQAAPFDGPAVVIAPADAFSWKCSLLWRSNSSNQKGIDMYVACRSQYRRADLEARPLFIDRPEWVCVERR